MPIDKKLYREAMEYYRQWNEAEKSERLCHGRKLTSVELWQQYVTLTEFLWKSCPLPSPYQQKQKIEALNRYYSRIKKLEAWRSSRGKLH